MKRPTGIFLLAESDIFRTDTAIVLPERVQGDNPPDVMMTDMPLVKVWGDAGLFIGNGLCWSNDNSVF